jgi:hypothetical protein
MVKHPVDECTLNPANKGKGKGKGRGAGKGKSPYSSSYGIHRNSAIDKQLDQNLRDMAKTSPSIFLVHDSGATRNLLCGTTSKLLPYLQNRRASSPGFVIVGGGRRLPYHSEGKICGITFTIVLDLHYDLYSAIAAAKRGISTVIDYHPDGTNKSYLHDKRKNTLTSLIENNGLLMIPMDTFLASCNSWSLSVSSPTICYGLAHDVLPTLHSQDADFLLHRRLGHMSVRGMRLLRKMGTIGVHVTGPLHSWCQCCHTARQKREPIHKVSNRHPNSLPGQHLHSDLAVISIPAIGNYYYALTVVDEGADKYYIKLLCSKTDTLHAMRDVAAEISSFTQNNVLQWTFDRGTEFLNANVKSYVRDDLHASAFYSNVERPWENGLAERSFGVLFEIARAMLHDAECPPHLWGFALQHAVYIRNR